jgi:hypothetical protein
MDIKVSIVITTQKACLVLSYYKNTTHAYGVSVNHSSVYFARSSNDNITSSKSWFNKIVSEFSLVGKVRFT